MRGRGPERDESLAAFRGTAINTFRRECSHARAVDTHDQVVVPHVFGQLPHCDASSTTFRLTIRSARLRIWICSRQKQMEPVPSLRSVPPTVRSVVTPCLYSTSNVAVRGAVTRCTKPATKVNGASQHARDTLQQGLDRKQHGHGERQNGRDDA